VGMDTNSPDLERAFEACIGWIWRPSLGEQPDNNILDELHRQVGPIPPAR
jgi:hypothetical protein